jgi:hypothetical protein
LHVEVHLVFTTTRYLPPKIEIRNRKFETQQDSKYASKLADHADLELF